VKAMPAWSSIVTKSIAHMHFQPSHAGSSPLNDLPDDAAELLGVDCSMSPRSSCSQHFTVKETTTWL